MNALTTTPVRPNLTRLGSVATRLFDQPAVRRAMPALAVLATLALVLGGWALLRTPDYRPVLPMLADGDKAAVLAALRAGNIAERVDPVTGAVDVPENQVAAARILLAGQGLPKAAATGYDLLGAMPLGTSRAVETMRLKQAEESALAASVMAIDGVETATVHLAAGEASVFVRDRAAPTAAVLVRLAPGRVLGDVQVRAVQHLVASAVAGLATEAVSVVDQSGHLLTRDGAGSALGTSAEQLAYQASVEGQYRQRVRALLTPVLGDGNFTAEVSADLDFTENNATHESFDKDGVLRSEQGSSAGDAAPPPAARGIPGALSNTAPPAAQLAAAPTAAAPPAAIAAGGGLKSTTFTRSFEVGKVVSVTRGGIGQVRRLSVAVLVRDSALGASKAQAAQLATLTGLVRSAVGFDARRGDVVTIAGRSFAVVPEPVAEWYDRPIVRTGGEAAVALIVFALLLFGIVRPALKRRPALPATTMPLEASPVSGTIDYADKLAATKILVADDVTRASTVVRQMIRADAA